MPLFSITRGILEQGFGGFLSRVKDPIDSAGSQAKIFKVALPVSLEAVFQVWRSPASLAFSPRCRSYYIQGQFCD